jgi:hypothetical protein
MQTASLSDGAKRSINSFCPSCEAQINYITLSLIVNAAYIGK